MGRLGLSNNAQTTISTTGGINSTATSFAPTSITGFPDATVQSFQIKIDSEIMQVTGYSSPNWTVVRGQEGTTAASHAEQAAIYQPLTKAALLSLLANRDEADWTPPVAANFTWVNQGGATVAQVNEALVIAAPAATGNSLRIQKITLPGTPYTITARFRLGKIAATGGCGFVWRESSSSKLIRIAFESDAITIDKFTNETTYAGSGYVSLLGLDPNAPLRWVRLKDDGTNRSVSLSADGVNWIIIHSIGRTDFLTPDQAGFFVDTGTSGSVNTLVGSTILTSWAVS